MMQLKIKLLALLILFIIHLCLIDVVFSANDPGYRPPTPLPEVLPPTEVSPPSGVVQPKVPGTSVPVLITPNPEVTAQLLSDPSLLPNKLDIAMRKLLKDPKTLEISFLHVNPIESSKGHFKKIIIKTTKANVDNLILHVANVEFTDVFLDTTKLIREERIETISVGTINMDVRVLEADLNAFLMAKSAKIKVKNPSTKMKPGLIEISGSAKYSFMKVNFWAKGIFRVHDAREIWFHPNKLKFNNMAMPRTFLGTIVKRINPVLNMEKFPFRLNLHEIRIEQGALHFLSARTGQ